MRISKSGNILRRVVRPAWALSLGILAGCCYPDTRRLDPEHPQPVVARMKLRFEPGIADRDLIQRLEPGDILAFRASEASSDGSVMFWAALWSYSHVAIVFPFNTRGTLRVLTADSDRGVVIDTVENCVRGREFYVFAYPQETLNLKRLAEFAFRAQHLGRLDYDWSAAVFGLNSLLTPNVPGEVDGEYTCATVVAAALHYSGLSLDRAYCPCQFVGPGDIIFSKARRNMNFDPPPAGRLPVLDRRER